MAAAVVTAAAAVAAAYAGSVALLLVSERLRNALVFLHWLRPPAFAAPLSRLEPHRLAAFGRCVRAGHLRGWHILPPGPPYPPLPASAAGCAAPPAGSVPALGCERDGDGDDDARNTFFDDALADPAGARVVVFFHGNSGTRAFPSKRVDMIKMLGAHLNAHIVTFDYTGFADSPGQPSEAQLYADARTVHDWVAARVDASTADVILYGQSLGTFAAAHLASSLFPREGARYEGDSLGEELTLAPLATDSPVRALVLDAPPASVVDAAMTHPSTFALRQMPGFRGLADRALRSVSLDNARRVRNLNPRVPLLILHGENDTFIDISQGRRVYQAAVDAGNAFAQFAQFPGIGHVNVNSAPNYLRVLDSFLTPIFLRNSEVTNGGERRVRFDVPEKGAASV